MSKTDLHDLEALFAAARADPPAPSAAFRARVLADALVVQPRAPLWRRLLTGVGGPAGVGAMITATCVGFWMGVAPPTTGLDPLPVLESAGMTGGIDRAPELFDFGWEGEDG